MQLLVNGDSKYTVTVPQVEKSLSQQIDSVIIKFVNIR